MLSQVEDKEYWKTRFRNHDRKDWGEEGDKSWIEGYWNSRTHPHRKLIIEALRKLRPFTSVLEVGCNCGPNLWAIKQAFPKVEISGIDINKPAIFYGREKFPQVNFYHGDAEKLSFYNKTFDIILTDAVLIYTPPSKVHSVIQEFMRVAKKALVLVEWYDENSKLGVIRDFHWSRNYVELLRGYGLRTTKQKITPEMWPNEKWQKYGYIFTTKIK